MAQCDRCFMCKHKHPGKWTCEAFPAGIPGQIAVGIDRETGARTICDGSSPESNGIGYEITDEYRKLMGELFGVGA